MTDGKVRWKSREIMIWKVRRKDREIPSLDEFKTVFLEEMPDKEATVEVHHPALKLSVREGSQNKLEDHTNTDS